jgi:hypothetical protein
MAMSYIQVKHRLRNIKQKITGVPVGVIGGYHGGNLGDMALGASVANALGDKGIKSGLQTIYNLSKWPAAEFAIVGGGAVGYADSLQKVAERYKGHYDKVALLGVDFNEKTYTGDALELIKNAAFVSGRSESQAEKMIKISGRKDIIFHPDIAFSLYREFCEKEREKVDEQRPKKLLLNLIPLYGRITDGKVVPVEEYRAERQDLYQSFDQMQRTYESLIRTIVIKALADGYEVETIPFTPEDGEYGELILSDLNVKHVKYHADPYTMMKHMAGASQIFATRYHTTIFAIKLGIPIIPIAYAVKNEMLLHELGVSRDTYLSTGDLANGVNTIPSPVKVSSSVLNEFELRSRAAIDASIAALKIGK